MIRLLLSFCLLAQPALALTCLAPDPVRAFQEADASPDLYQVVLGQFFGGPTDALVAQADGAPTSRFYRAQFKGHVFGRNGPGRATEIPVMVHEVCLASWCPSLLRGQDVLTFLQINPDAPAELRIDACVSNMFYTPQEADLKAIRRCFAAGC